MTYRLSAEDRAQIARSKHDWMTVEHIVNREVASALAPLEALADEWETRASRATDDRRAGVAEGDASHTHYARTCRNHAAALRAVIAKENQ